MKKRIFPGFFLADTRIDYFSNVIFFLLMAQGSSIVEVLESCTTSPQFISNSSTTFPLTFFDIPWLSFPPSKPLFLFDYHHSTSHFLSTTLPILKHSLSLSLHHFLPFSAKLVVPSKNKKPTTVYTPGDSVSLTVPESSGDFTYFTSNFAKNANGFHSLVPDLDPITSNQAQIPLLSVKVTIFPCFGLCIGLAYHHVVADGRTFNNFIKTWALFCAQGQVSSLMPNLSSSPSFDRTVIKDAHGLEQIFLKEFWKRKSLQEVEIRSETHLMDLCNMVRATFVVRPVDMERIKKWILDSCKKKNQPQPIHLSPYVLTCSFVWICLVKAQAQKGGSENCYRGHDPVYFGFIAGGLTRLDYPVPSTYVGNCVGFGRSTASREALTGEDGIVVAANAIGGTIKKLDKEFFVGADEWVLDWEVLFGSDKHVMVSGSPKTKLYETDFGWGRPKKIEDIAIDRMHAISLTDSGETKGGMEVGLSLPKDQMYDFRSLFIEGLKEVQKLSLFLLVGS